MPLVRYAQGLAGRAGPWDRRGSSSGRLFPAAAVGLYARPGRRHAGRHWMPQRSRIPAQASRPRASWCRRCHAASTMRAPLMPTTRPSATCCAMPGPSPSANTRRPTACRLTMSKHPRAPRAAFLPGVRSARRPGWASVTKGLEPAVRSGAIRHVDCGIGCRRPDYWCHAACPDDRAVGAVGRAMRKKVSRAISGPLRWGV